MTMFSKLMSGAARGRSVVNEQKQKTEPKVEIEHTPETIRQCLEYYANARNSVLPMNYPKRFIVEESEIVLK